MMNFREIRFAKAPLPCYWLRWKQQSRQLSLTQNSRNRPANLSLFGSGEINNYRAIANIKCLGDVTIA